MDWGTDDGQGIGGQKSEIGGRRWCVREANKLIRN